MRIDGHAIESEVGHLEFTWGSFAPNRLVGLGVIHLSKIPDLRGRMFCRASQSHTLHQFYYHVIQI